LLSEIEITYFRSRIDDVLREGRPTGWQRQFLLDMQEKMARYGTRTRLSAKQLATLRRLTRIEGSADLSFITQKPRASVERRQYSSRRRLRRFSYLQTKLIVFASLLVVVLVGHALQGGMSFPGLSPIPVSAALPTASQFSTQSFSITDGDTIRMSDGTPVRLVGFNTPEKFEPKCDREAALGNRATERLRELVSSGRAAVTRIACSCPPGTEGTDRCNHGRSCGILKVDGRDVGQTLISEGLAVPFVCGPTSCPRTPRPWCG
jgi:endonuclease YncB( thermonuclease family)